MVPESRTKTSSSTCIMDEAGSYHHVYQILDREDFLNVKRRRREPDKSLKLTGVA